MKNYRSAVAILSLSCLAFVSSVHAAEMSAGRLILGHDLFAAGNTLQVSQPVVGDALLAGDEVASTNQIGGDLVAAGRELHVGGSVGHDLYAAGRRVQLDGAVTDNARIAGGEIVITRGAHVGGGLSLAAQRVEFDGQTQGYLSIAAGITRIDGPVGGDVQVAGRELDLGPAAQISGRLVFRGRQPPRLAAGARVGGGVQFIRHQAENSARVDALMHVASWIWLAGWMVAGAVLLALWPIFARTASGAARTRVLPALGVGVLVLLVTPVVIALLFVTVVGIPLALLLLGAYLLMLPVGYLTSALAIGDRVLMRKGEPSVGVGRRAGALVITLLVLFVLTRVPVLGTLLGLLLVLAGLGGLVLAGVETGRSGTGAPRAV